MTEFEGEQAAQHPHAHVVAALLDAFSRQDRAAIEALLDPDCVWRVPGNNGIAGTYEGRPAVLGLFRTLKRLFSAPAEFEVIDIATSQDRVISYQYGVIVVGGQRHRFKECLVYRINAGRVVEVEEFQADQAAFDAVFTHEAVAAVQTG